MVEAIKENFVQQPVDPVHVLLNDLLLINSLLVSFGGLPVENVEEGRMQISLALKGSPEKQAQLTELLKKVIYQRNKDSGDSSNSPVDLASQVNETLQEQYHFVRNINLEGESADLRSCGQNQGEMDSLAEQPQPPGMRFGSMKEVARDFSGKLPPLPQVDERMEWVVEQEPRQRVDAAYQQEASEESKRSESVNSEAQEGDAGQAINFQRAARDGQLATRNQLFGVQNNEIQRAEVQEQQSENSHQSQQAEQEGAGQEERPQLDQAVQEQRPPVDHLDQPDQPLVVLPDNAIVEPQLRVLVDPVLQEPLPDNGIAIVQPQLQDAQVQAQPQLPDDPIVQAQPQLADDFIDEVRPQPADAIVLEQPPADAIDPVQVEAIVQQQLPQNLPVDRQDQDVDEDSLSEQSFDAETMEEGDYTAIKWSCLEEATSKGQMSRPQAQPRNNQ